VSLTVKEKKSFFFLTLLAVRLQGKPFMGFIIVCGLAPLGAVHLTFPPSAP
jgi:hypothetical protein